jgi:hypothetical protein
MIGFEAMHRIWLPNRQDFWSGFMVFVIAGSAAGAERLPVPSTEERQQASTRILDIFKSEVDKAGTADAKSTLAKKLIDIAAEDASAAERFVLLDAAQSLAIKAGDARVALKAADKKSEAFQVSTAKTKAAVLTGLAKTASGDSAALVTDGLLELATVELSADQLEGAKIAAQDAAIAARRSKDKNRIKAVAEILDTVKVREKEIDKIRPWIDRLASNNDDLEAVEYVGKYQCFQAERWDKGLPLVARSNHQELAALARADIASGEDQSCRLAVADKWVAYAEHLKQAPEANACLRRAEFHYQAALAGLTGLEKAKVTQNLEAIGKKIGSSTREWMPLFRGDDPKIWNTKTDDGFTRFAVPIAELPNNIRFLRLRRQNGSAVIVGMTKERLGGTSFDGRYGWNGAGQHMYSDGMLGIMDANLRNPNVQGAVAVGYRVQGKPDEIFGGYGFGHSQLSGTKQDFCWSTSDPLPTEPLEISVICRDLNSRELPLLLR